MNYKEEFKPNEKYFSRINLEMMFWVGLVYLIVWLFLK
jgi:hypothetical protein